MAKYTTEVRSIVEAINEQNSFSPIATDIIQVIDERIEDARAKIFSFQYPINAADKSRFECNFIRHFYTREIGLETVALWKLKLADKLNLIIPKYNKLWDEATRYADYDMLSNVDYSVVREYIGAKLANGTENVNATRTDNLTETNTGTDTRTDNLTQRDTGTNTRTDNLKQKTTGTDTDTTNRDLVRAYSDTPQGNMENLLDERYLTNLTHEYENGSSVERAKNTEVNNTGTQQDAVDRTKTNTGTQQDVIDRTKRNTGTVGDVSNKTKNDRVDDTIKETVKHKGKDGGITFAEAIIKARETYLNIDLMLCNELNDLFMMIW